MDSPSRICIFGAGSVGCYLGGRLISGGASVRMIGRDAQARQLHSCGLTLTGLRGNLEKVRAEHIDFVVDNPQAATGAELILFTVKSAATEQAGRSLAAFLNAGSTVISFQNGLDNTAVLQRLIPQCTVLAGMVPFNVLSRGEGVFHQGSEGRLMVQRDLALAPHLAQFSAAGLTLEQRDDMPAVQRAKLLLNLNNAINALCGVPLKAELSQRNYRRCLAAAQREGLRLFSAAQQSVAALTAVPAHWLPFLLEMPDMFFKLVANRMLAIDPLARSSMWEDLEAGRTSEVDWLNGELLRLAARIGIEAPVNQRLLALIRAAERGGRRDWLANELLAQLRRAA